MEATLTELRRLTGRVAEAVARRESVQLTRHGETIAEIHPSPRKMNGIQFAKMWRQRKRLDKATADEVAKVLKELDRAK